MSERDLIARQLLKFLKLETIAEALYRQHLSHVPPAIKPLVREFAEVEGRHRQTFAELYTTWSKKPVPRFRFDAWCVCAAARVFEHLGLPAIFWFECRLEAKAVKDYTAALQWVRTSEIRTALSTVLHDEQAHPPLKEVLQTFREDEKEHIRRMKKYITRKKR